MSHPALLLGNKPNNCQTLGLVLRLRVDFVLPLSQEDQEQEQEQEEQEPSHQNLSEGGALRRLKFDA